MNYLKKVERLEELRKQVAKAYQEMADLKKEIVNDLIEAKEKEVALSEYQVYTLIWAYDKQLDIEMLKEKYQDVYELGLMTTFSTERALKSVPQDVLKSVIRDCTTISPRYILKRKKGGIGGKELERHFIKKQR